MTSWKDNKEELSGSRPRQSPRPRERPLTKTIVKALPDSRSEDPSASVEASDSRDFVERHYLENATAKQKAQYHEMESYEKDNELYLYAQSHKLA